MSIFKWSAAVLALATAGMVSPTAAAQTKGKVLVVMSSAHELDLKDGKSYSTGYYLNEFVVPFRKLLEAGYEPVIANPRGDEPVMDANSNNKMFFGGDDAARADALKYAQGIAQLKHPKTLASVVAEGTGGYVGLFIPGGHAPMVDLLKDKNLGKILTSFHDTGRPTGIICHGPIVLLSALNDPDAFIASMIANDGKANSLAKGWPYAGYRVTVFSTGEEQQLEGPAGLGGSVQFYPVNALAEAGAHVDTVANWHSNVIVDRELITGQQPMSAPEFGDTLVAKLKAHRK
ncbi:type 1 glutamine amidotransferase domain-containing protein [Dyella sp. GSA-30]|uniref:type 1 glutamine amidotransferase domain-containing protein n=1 Tax=Dyella sp. GSA-30 TaxID=2994496 RepID=UPI0024903ADF|nr:type 1 glutamine amidotransferase domain-containing protein [Dyella sp. GSA-30]BDU18951.1 thiazole biosynthesis protein ThiJ [Dyella sp. GSA-30]